MVLLVGVVSVAELLVLGDLFVGELSGFISGLIVTLVRVHVAVFVNFPRSFSNCDKFDFE